ncbi:4_t:CDS:2 [Ambispora gerdemannii]|uniref:4_t:CDS:1 n=1 Tax=Ambispora gerdemannii TaxID=144530 RepID=A0A9N9G3B2_9GLOM|nr:4_t:CDS:2 [Ambispora gerdemannii]
MRYQLIPDNDIFPICAQNWIQLFQKRRTYSLVVKLNERRRQYFFAITNSRNAVIPVDWSKVSEQRPENHGQCRLLDQLAKGNCAAKDIDKETGPAKFRSKSSGSDPNIISKDSSSVSVFSSSSKTTKYILATQ